MVWQTQATGGIQHNLVDRRSVDSLVSGIRDRNGYLSASTFFGGGILSALPTLAAQVKNPIPVYFIIAIEAALLIGALGLFLRERNRVSERRNELDSQGIVYTITAPPGVAWGPTPNPPRTGTQNP